MTSSKLKVLVIDDQNIMLQAISMLLESAMDLEVHTHADSDSALAMADQFQPNVIFLDLVMEPVDGLTLLSRMRALPKLSKVPVVMLSSAEDAQTKVEAFRRGANDYLVKLPDAIELIARARYHARAHQAELEREAAYAALLESRAALERQQAQLLAVNFELRESTLTDALTGLRNRRYHRIYIDSLPNQPEPLPMIGERRQLPSSSFTYYLFDLDHFKQVNDQFGHDAGDAVLVEVANRLRQLLRADDAVMRWGGEEFLIVVRGQERSAAHQLAGRILKTISDEPIDVGVAQPLAITCSLGFSVWPWYENGEPLASLTHDQTINFADTMAYVAKLEGRNRAFGLFQRGQSIEPRELLDLSPNNVRDAKRRSIEIVTEVGPEAKPGALKLSKPVKA
jgi:two-component system, chemotaxis family, response regulator WspR